MNYKNILKELNGLTLETVELISRFGDEKNIFNTPTEMVHMMEIAQGALDKGDRYVTMNGKLLLVLDTCEIYESIGETYTISVENTKECPVLVDVVSLLIGADLDEAIIIARDAMLLSIADNNDEDDTVDTKTALMMTTDKKKHYTGSIKDNDGKLFPTEDNTVKNMLTEEELIELEGGDKPDTEFDIKEEVHLEDKANKLISKEAEPNAELIKEISKNVHIEDTVEATPEVTKEDILQIAKNQNKKKKGFGSYKDYMTEEDKASIERKDKDTFGYPKGATVHKLGTNKKGDKVGGFVLSSSALNKVKVKDIVTPVDPEEEAKIKPTHAGTFDKKHTPKVTTIKRGDKVTYSTNGIVVPKSDNTNVKISDNNPFKNGKPAKIQRNKWINKK